MSGNQGIRDIQLALRWVQDKIGYFGGDPARVTVVGGSGGGAFAVNFLLSSPLSKGLFSGAILQSGTVSGSGPGVQHDSREVALEKTKLLAANVSCSTEPWDPVSVEECLKNTTVEKLLKATRGRTMGNIDSFSQHCPILPADYEELMKSGFTQQVPIMIGENVAEGAFFAKPSLLELSLIHI